jgi:hypothetical protein
MERMTNKSSYRKQVFAEVEAVPPEFLPFLLQMIRAYRDSVSLKPAAESFRRGWREAQAGQTVPVKHLWSGINGE